MTEKKEPIRTRKRATKKVTTVITDPVQLNALIISLQESNLDMEKRIVELRGAIVRREKLIFSIRKDGKHEQTVESNVK